MIKMFEVTSLNRPDTAWRFVDKAGHEHRWHADGHPADSYNPESRHTLPTLVNVEDAPGGDDYPAVSHYECKQCGEHVRPGTRADDTRQFIRGFSR